MPRDISLDYETYLKKHFFDDLMELCDSLKEMQERGMSVAVYGASENAVGNMLSDLV